MKERGSKCWIGHELDCVAVLSALVSSMATKRPEMTPQETQVSQGWTFPRVPAVLSHWLETTHGGVPLMVMRGPLVLTDPLLYQVHRAAHHASQGLPFRGCERGEI